MTMTDDDIYRLDALCDEMKIESNISYAYSKYNRTLQAAKSLGYCPRCKSISVGTGRQKECTSCQFSYCNKCNMGFHDGLCGERTLSDYMRDMGIQSCPRCGQGVERSAACSYMTCRCGCYFHLMCGRSVPKNHHQCGCGKKEISAKTQHARVGAVAPLEVDFDLHQLYINNGWNFNEVAEFPATWTSMRVVYQNTMTERERNIINNMNADLTRRLTPAAEKHARNYGWLEFIKNNRGIIPMTELCEYLRRGDLHADPVRERGAATVMWSLRERV
jgi:hypothetical protein